jgi:AraC-like DNA-binding protein
VLEDIVEKVYELNPNQEFINAAFEYYLRLLLASYQGSEEEDNQNISLTDRALAYIEKNYRNQIRVEDVAAHINRTPNYTSHLLKLATGLTPVEHIREVRIRNACRQLAYSNVPVEEVISSCGFISASYFHRVFREKLGTTPNRYRTSHMVSDTFYLGEDQALDVPYGPDKQFFTYIPGARKRVDWKTPREYYNQDVK